MTELRLGDCFDHESAALPTEPDETLLVHAVDVVPCDEPHSYEVISIVRHPGGDDAENPGEDALMEHGVGECLDRFEGVVGISFADSILDMRVIVPANSWAIGDRDLLCVAQHLDGRPLDRTVIGSGL